MEKKTMSDLKRCPSPVVSVLGGAPENDRIFCIRDLLDLSDTIIIGGGLASTFLKAKGGRIGRSAYDEKNLDTAVSLLKDADERNVKIMLPLDTLAANEMTDGLKPSLEGSMALFEDKIGMDIGPRTVNFFSNIILRAGTVIYSGCMGVWELPYFRTGTEEIIKVVSRANSEKIICGKDSRDFFEKQGVSIPSVEYHDDLQSFIRSRSF